MDGLKRKRKSSNEYVRSLLEFVKQQNFQYATGWKRGKECVLYKNGKCGIWKFLYYLSTEELVSRGNAVLPHCILLPNTHLSFRYFNQADIKASPCSSFCQDRFPEVNAVRQEARDCTVHTISSPSPLSSPLPCLAGLCFSPHLSSSQGWGAWLGPWQIRLHYRDVTKQGDQPARPKRPQSLSHSPAETFALRLV